MLLNPGLAKQDLCSKVVISSMPESLDNLFEDDNQSQQHVLCLTAGSDVPGSWLDALNSDTPTHLERRENLHHHTNQAEKRLSLRERLILAGIPLRKKIAIRLARLKSSDLQPTYLNTKINITEKWVAEMTRLHANLNLPALDKVKAEWEKPYDGDRFRILRIYFKTDTGLDNLTPYMIYFMDQR